MRTPVHVWKQAGKLRIGGKAAAGRCAMDTLFQKFASRLHNSPAAALLKRFLGGVAFLNIKSRVAIGIGAIGLAIFSFYYLKYSRMVDRTLRSGTFESGSLLYAAPRTVAVGEEAQAGEIAAYLSRCGYSQAPSKVTGWYRKTASRIEIHPGPGSYVGDDAVIELQAGRVARITSLDQRTGDQRTGLKSHDALAMLPLEPEVITNLYDQNREKQLIARFNDIPKVLVDAVTSAEDKHFFHHWGFDPSGIVRALRVDLKDRRLSQGASTITQQLARTLFLGHDRGWRRKIPETFITLHLENSLSKRQIFEYYANSIYLGNLGSFGVRGFAKASQLYLGKDLSQVNLPDAALLAGLIEAPYSLNPFRFPERAKARRNAILKAMLANGVIARRAFDEASATPLNVAREADSSDAPYFVDLVDEALATGHQELDLQNQSFRVYTTLDSNLQRDAVEAVRVGIQETDRLWKSRSKQYGTSELPRAQVALVALDTQTGEVKALIGGRNYGLSQFNRATASRQPGSAFKPFAYAAALTPAVNADSEPLTPASIVVDEPYTFSFRGKDYDPGSYHEDFAGPVTLRFALAHSLNVPAVKVAEAAGYDRVARLARAAGLGANVQGTPSIALGAYEVTPLELAEAYTIFANYGSRLPATFIRSIRDHKGGTVFESHLSRKPVLDPRVAYLVENMMEEVLRSGTGWGVRSRGFLLPAAGKTGSSHDAWFAGFTSKLICVVWVGFDDNRDIQLEGARSALPLWTEFMKRAHQHPEYRDVHEIAPPSGIVSVQIDADTGELATPACSNVRYEVFIQGTEPRAYCHLHAGVRASGPPPVRGAAPVLANSP